MGRICAFEGCSNSYYQIQRWQKRLCTKHMCRHMDSACNCPKPFTLYPFPWDPNHRLQWIKIINRKDGNKNWQPNVNSRVCSKHFEGGKYTEDHPYPTVHLGESTQMKARKAPAEISIPAKKPRLEMSTDMQPQQTYSTVTERNNSTSSCSKEHHITNRTNRKNLKAILTKYELTDSNYDEQKPAVTSKTVDKTLHFLRTDKSVKTFTGLQNKASFNALLGLVSKKAACMRYRTGIGKTNKIKHKLKKTSVKSGPKRKLTMAEELLLVLMKLRQACSHEILAAIFGVSVSVVSPILNTWIRLLSHELKPLILWPTKKAIVDQVPSTLPKTPEYCGPRCTIDCTEIFIERPRSMEFQKLTWSDYKKQNTVKFLVSLAPNSMISFLSDACGGSVSDEVIVRQSGFLEKIEEMDVVMACKIFPVQKDLLNRGAWLVTPHLKAGQMFKEEYKRKNSVGTARIHMQKCLEQWKDFQILNGTLPISMVPLIDDIAIICASLCNLLPSFVL